MQKIKPENVHSDSAETSKHKYIEYFSRNSDTSAVLLFDGDCNFCGFWVDYLIRYDTRREFRFAALQSKAGRKFLSEAGLMESTNDSILVFDRSGVYSYGKAIIRILHISGGIHKFAGDLLLLMPEQWLDSLYKLVARYRYRIFGYKTKCRILNSEDRKRFIY